MAEIVNLRQARKAEKRRNEARKAEENRKRFGRTKAEKAIQSHEARRADALLDGAKRNVKPGGDEAGSTDNQLPSDDAPFGRDVVDQ